jgi:hypothetical protein
MLIKTLIALGMIVAVGSGARAANTEGPPATDVCSHAPGPIPSPTGNAICNQQGWFKDR